MLESVPRSIARNVDRAQGSGMLGCGGFLDRKLLGSSKWSGAVFAWACAQQQCRCVSRGQRDGNGQKWRSALGDGAMDWGAGYLSGTCNYRSSTLSSDKHGAILVLCQRNSLCLSITGVGPARLTGIRGSASVFCPGVGRTWDGCMSWACVHGTFL